MAAAGWIGSPRRGAGAYDPYSWHWYERGNAICGTYTRPHSADIKRPSAEPPHYARRICRRCRAALAARTTETP